MPLTSAHVKRLFSLPTPRISLFICWSESRPEGLGSQGGCVSSSRNGRGGDCHNSHQYRNLCMGASIPFYLYLYTPPSENTFLPEESLTPSKRINFQKSFKPCVGKNIARRVWKALLKSYIQLWWSSEVLDIIQFWHQWCCFGQDLNTKSIMSCWPQKKITGIPEIIGHIVATTQEFPYFSH